jgi:transposase
MIETTGKLVYLACGVTDLRQQINGLARSIVNSFHLDVFSGALFVFCNRRRDIIRILEWDSDGFWMHTKRLERGRFMWPVDNTSEQVLDISGTELQQIISSTALEKRFRGDRVTERLLC